MAMMKELEQRITERWPAWFNVAGDARESLMRYGFEHGDGWFKLAWRLCEQLEQPIGASKQESGCAFQVLQVKQKFGGLRFYTKYGNDAVSRAIEAAQVESFHTCEVCGKPGACRGAVWLATDCDEHAYGG